MANIKGLVKAAREAGATIKRRTPKSFAQAKQNVKRNIPKMLNAGFGPIPKAKAPTSNYDKNTVDRPVNAGTPPKPKFQDKGIRGGAFPSHLDMENLRRFTKKV